MHCIRHTWHLGAAQNFNGELMDSILIHPDSLRAVWPDVRAGLETMPKDDWIVEDVYHAIKSGAAALYIGQNDSGFCGFLVLQKLLGEFSRDPILHCWLAYNHGEGEIYDKALEFLKSQARQMGAKRLTFGSPRPGWGKRYACTTATYEIPLEG